jgi:Zn-dependent M28 family amino/carboxypeptidase
MYRVAGASRAAVLGAAAVLVRSITPFSLRTPHTGTLIYSEKAPKIPAAAITVEDAEAIHRLVNRGVLVKVRLKMSARFEPDADSANVIGEIPGSEKPGEVVVLGGHIDSWDVGQGAQDDGSGAMASLEAVALIQKLGLKPRRTIRLVLWVNEENGGAGGKAYRAMVGEAIRNHVAAIEMDGGAEKPIGFGATSGHSVMPGAAASSTLPANPDALSPAAYERLGAIARLLTPIGATQITHNGGGSDIEPLMESGVPGIGELSSGAHYFDWHHTEADTFDKINPQDFRESVASMAVMTYVLADMPDRLSDLK